MFDTMISKSLIQWIWIAWSGLIVIAGLIALTQSGGPVEAFIVLVGTGLGLGFARVLCEGMIVIFMIHENLSMSTKALESISQSETGSLARLQAIQTQLAQRPLQAVPSTATAKGSSGSSVQASAANRSGSDSPPTSSDSDEPDVEPVGRIGLRPTRSGWAEAYSDAGESKSKLGTWPDRNSNQ